MAKRSRAVVAKRPRTVLSERISTDEIGKPYVMRRSGVLVPAASAARLAAGSFRAAENPRRRFKVIDGSGDFHLDERTRMLLRAQSRDLERNNTLYNGLLANWCTYTIGSGPRPIFNSSSPAFNAAATERWREDAKTCRLDGRRLFPWPIWCAMLLRCITRDGDAGVLHLADASGLLVESERVTEANLDGMGRIIGYRVSQPSVGGASPLTHSGTPVAAQDMSLPAWRDRPSQTRGMPAMSATLDEWERLDSLHEAEIISAESAALPWIIVTSQGGGNITQPKPRAGSTSVATPGTPVYDGWVRTDAGSMFGLPPGFDGKPWIPNRPNLDVPEFVRQALRNLCLPLLPYEVAFLDIGALNYAAIRGLGKLAQRKIDDARTYLLEPTCSRMARDWARVEILHGRLPFVRDFAKHSWDWDQLEIRDREKDAGAVAQEMENGTTTLQDELGPDWQATITQSTREQIAKLKAKAEVIKAAKAAAVLLGIDDWRDLVPGLTPSPSPQVIP